MTALFPAYQEVLAAVVLVSAGVLAYTYVGYPVLVVLLARIFPLRVRSAAWEPTVTVCVPVYNAAAYIAGKVESLLAQDYPPDKIEILFYSDGSADESVEILHSYTREDARVKLIVGERRQGKPNALNRMREAAAGEVLVLTDIRQPLCKGAVRSLVAALADPEVGCVSGNLVLLGKAGAGVYWRYENWIRRNEGKFRGMVGITGPLYALRRADLPDVPGTIVLDDMWVPMQLQRKGKRIIFCETAEAYDDAFADQREFMRKARTLAGNYRLLVRMPWLLVPFVNPSWFETFSHKVLRLMCPWAILTLLGASLMGALAPVGLGEREIWIFRLLLGGQMLFFLLALAGARAGQLAGTARTFIVLHAAAMVGLWRFLRGTQQVTW